MSSTSSVSDSEQEEEAIWGDDQQETEFTSYNERNKSRKKRRKWTKEDAMLGIFKGDSDEDADEMGQGRKEDTFKTAPIFVKSDKNLERFTSTLNQESEHVDYHTVHIKQEKPKQPPIVAAAAAAVAVDTNDETLTSTGDETTTGIDPTTTGTIIHVRADTAAHHRLDQANNVQTIIASNKADSIEIFDRTRAAIKAETTIVIATIVVRMATRNSETRTGTRKEISGEVEIIGTIMEAIKEDMINGIKTNSTVEIMQMTRVSKIGWHSTNNNSRPTQPHGTLIKTMAVRSRLTLPMTVKRSNNQVTHIK